MIRPTRAQPRRHRPPAPAAALVALALLVVACTPSTGALGSPATPPATTAPSVDAPSIDVTPAVSAAPSPSPSPTSPAGSATPAPTFAASPTPSPSIAGRIVRNYFFLGSFTDPAALVPVLRDVPSTLAVATMAMTELLNGPSDGELAARPAMYTTIPAGTRLLGISIDQGTAIVDLSAEFASGGGSASMLGRLAQVVYTLTQFPTIQRVTFRLDGRPVTTFGGEGIVLDHPVGRDDFHDQLPAIFVDRPAWGAVLGNPGTVSGLANVFEAQLRVRLLDGSGAVLADRSVMADCGTGCWGTFSTSLGYAVTGTGWGTLRVYDPSPKDGAPEHVRDYPVWLAPAG